VLPFNDLLRGTRLVLNFVKDPESLFEDCTRLIPWDRSIPGRPFASFGVPYSDSEDRTTIPFGEMLEPLRSGIQTQLGFLPNSCSCHWYLRGDSFMGFHSDNVEDIDEATGVAIVSLGDERTLRFRSKENRLVTHDFRLASGSLFFMNRELQNSWMHGVPKQAVSGQRVSLVFRRVPN
jgi:alkylated DNA repair dioxygenase AlkB